MMSPRSPVPVMCLMGPTAIGKSDLAFALAEMGDVEIVSVDSAMVYQGLDVGTAKPTLEQRRRIRHHLLDIRQPNERYSAANFAHDSYECLREIREHGRIPLMVGGTFLYFRALLKGLAALPGANLSLRRELNNEAAELGWPILHRRLQRLDPVSGKRIHPNDSQRIQRALEVYYLTGKPMSELQGKPPSPMSLEFDPVILWPKDRARLYQKIEQRFNRMMNQGFLAEVAALYRRGDLSVELPAIRSVGYRQLWSHLEGKCALEDAVEKAVIATRRYAKRQLTWLRQESCATTLIVDSALEAYSVLKMRLQRTESR